MHCTYMFDRFPTLAFNQLGKWDIHVLTLVDDVQNIDILKEFKKRICDYNPRVVRTPNTWAAMVLHTYKILTKELGVHFDVNFVLLDHEAETTLAGHIGQSFLFTYADTPNYLQAIPLGQPDNHGETLSLTHLHFSEYNLLILTLRPLLRALPIVDFADINQLFQEENCAAFISQNTYTTTSILVPTEQQLSLVA